VIITNINLITNRLIAFYDLKLNINSPVSTADVCVPIFQQTQEKLAIKKVPVFAISVAH